ncbi:MAG: NfeD family protein, partial [Tepidisphaeraceae bacterium]
CIIVQIDTYGGLVTAALDMSRFIKQQDEVRTIAFVDSKAISAGAMIALACDDIVMRPSGVIGDCAPIMYRDDGTLSALPETERAKMQSPVLADFRDSARVNGYDPLLVDAMVAVGRVVHLVQNNAGEKRFVDDATYKQLLAQDWRPSPGVPDPIDSADELLTVHAELAQKLGISKASVGSVQDLASTWGLNILGTLSPGLGEKLLALLVSPLARLLLIILFVVSLKLALATPGHGAPEAVALTSLGILVGAPLLTGYAEWWEVALIFGGLALIAFEVFVFPGHFVSAALGAAMMIFGLILTFVGPEPGRSPFSVPDMPLTWRSIQQGLIIVTGGLVCSLGLWFWLNRFLPKIPYFNRLVLTATTGGATTTGASSETDWPAVGAMGRAVTDLRPGGTAHFTDPRTSDTRNASVVSESGFVPAGTSVVVIESRGSYVLVRTTRPGENT